MEIEDVDGWEVVRWARLCCRNDNPNLRGSQNHSFFPPRAKSGERILRLLTPRVAFLQMVTQGPDLFILWLEGTPSRQTGGRDKV